VITILVSHAGGPRIGGKSRSIVLLLQKPNHVMAEAAA
jgi:hypothetical protein